MQVSVGVLIFTQAKIDAIGLCTRRWQGRAVNAAFTSIIYRYRAFLGRDFKALSGATISCLKDTKPVPGIHGKYTV